MSTEPVRSQHSLQASVVISTYNRADALRETLAAFADQDLGPDAFEVIVVDDGSSDHSQQVIQSTRTPYELRSVRHETNRGVSAGRNSGMRIARGRFLILVSDDVLVPRTFIRQHIETLEQAPGSWVVGGFRQLDSLEETAFGRYLGDLERSFEAGRKSRQLGPHLWEMSWPTARNLSLPAADVERIGLFDERFRTCCEDQDLAERARVNGVRFIYNDSIDCLHNDQAGDLRRYCSFQRRGARDTVLLCQKYPALHGQSPLVNANGPVVRQDGVRLATKKIVKRILSTPPIPAAVERALLVAERFGAPERLLRRGYTAAIGLAIFKGWREGLQAQR